MENKKRLIDANAVRDALYDADAITMNGVAIINWFPTVDAVEVVHGYWIDSYNTDNMGRIIEHGIDCSVCESVFKDDSREVVKRWKERFKVCPFCGAKMDGGNEDA